MIGVWLKNILLKKKLEQSQAAAELEREARGSGKREKLLRDSCLTRNIKDRMFRS